MSKRYQTTLDKIKHPTTQKHNKMAKDKYWLLQKIKVPDSDIYLT